MLLAVEKKFLKKALSDLKVKNFLYKELDKAGVSSIDIQKTPIATRIAVSVRRPGVVVGKRGKSIKDLCFVLEKEYGVENPQVEVIEVQKPALDAKLMAEKIGRRIEAKPQIKPVMRLALEEIMHAGALGAEIRVAGKVVGKGGKAKTFTVRKGFLKKSGEAKRLVLVGHYVAYLSAGAVGIKVLIVHPDTVFYDSKKKEKLVEIPPAAAIPAAAVTAVSVDSGSANAVVEPSADADSEAEENPS